MSVTNVSQTPKTPANSGIFPAGQITLFILITALFFLWAIPNNLNDVLIKQFMKSFEISRFQAGLLQSAFYMGYFLLSMPAALLMRKYGYKFGFIIPGCCFTESAHFFSGRRRSWGNTGFS
jgi:FHS family L-fucose permease-like MFS transporter